jgi:glycyl-radical enzyme activating protein
MSATTGLVLSIDRCSLHDGPGIRTTVFLKGCPLHCLWCHNPESISTKPELFFMDDRCSRCGACVTACPNGCHTVTDAMHTVDRRACVACGRCVQACPMSALQIKGKPMAVEDVMAEVVKDRVYYEESGGGLTISGGEPLLQIDFTAALLAAARAQSIHTCVETCGHVSWDRFERILPVTDLFLYDCKATDPVRHREFTGASDDLIRENLNRVLASGKSVILRCPLVPGVNDDDAHLQGIAALSQSHAGIVGVEVMPYHAMARAKYGRIGKAYTLSAIADADEGMKRRWLERLSALGCRIAGADAPAPITD